MDSPQTVHLSSLHLSLVSLLSLPLAFPHLPAFFPRLSTSPLASPLLSKARRPPASP